VATQSAVVFNGLGRITPIPAANITIDVTNPNTTFALRVVVSPGGQVRMCNPAFAATDPQGCP
jgi:type IV fimbrial biogenesis protein FimT